MSSFSGQVSASLDDAGEQGANNNSPGTVNTTNGSIDIKAVSGSASAILGFRFENVTIAQGATVSAASISVYTTSASRTMHCLVFCEAADNSAQFAATTDNISNRTESTHDVAWTATLTLSAFTASPSIATPVQDVISRTGFASGNALTVLLDDRTTQASNAVIQQYDGGSSEAAEISITYTSGGGTPAAPTGLSLALNADGTIQATWTNPSGTLTGASVQIATNSAFTAGVDSFTVSGSSVATATIESGIQPISRDTEYWVEVAAINSSGTGTYSASANITTGPAAPTGLAITNAASPVASWTNPTPGGASLTNSKLMYSTDLVHWTTVSVGSSVTNYTFSGLTANVVYYFAVSAIDTNGQGYWSHGGFFDVAGNSVAVANNVFVPAYTGATATASITLEPTTPDQLTTGWTKDGSDASFAQTLADTNDSNYVVPPANETQYLVVPLQNCPSNLLVVTGVVSNVRVKKTGSNLAGVLCSVESSAYYSANGASPYVNTNSATGAVVGGNAVPGSGTGETTSFADFSSPSDTTLSGTQGNADWTGAYLCLLWDDNTGAYALAEASVTITYWTIAPPSTPTGLAVVNDGSSPTTALDVSWSAAATAATYDLGQASSLGGSYSDTTGISGTTDTISGLTPATEYSFEVAATNAGGTSSYSSAVAWATASAAPSGVSATPSAGAALVAWTAPTMGTNCQIASFSIRYEYPPGNGNWTTITGISSGATSYLVTGLTPGVQYGFEVACLISSSNSDWSGTIQSVWGTEEDATTTGLLAASAGTFSLTGKSVALLHAYVLSAAKATFTETGEAAGLYKGYDLSASDATFALTGESVAFLWTHVLSVGVAAFSETGEAAGLYKGYALPAAAASFTDTGENVAVLDDHILPAALATFTLTAETAGLTYGYTLTAAAASYDLTGEDVTFLRDYVVSASFGQFIEFGESVDLLQGHVLNATLSVITLTGSNSVGFGLTLPAAAATYVFTGASSNLLWDHVLSASAATFSFTGKAAVLSSPFSVFADAAAFSLTGESVTFVHGRVLSASAATFALSGETVAVLHDRVMSAAKAVFSDTGEAATVLHDHKLPAAAASYSLVGKIAGLFRGYRVAAAKAVFSLTGESAGLHAKRLMNATAAAFTRTGKPVTFLFDIIMPAAAATFRLTGKPVTFANQLDAADGQFALTGKPATLLHDHVLPAAKATFALHGDPVLLSLGFSIFASPASFSLTGNAAGFKVGEPAAPASYDLTGKTVALLHDRTLPAAKAVYSLTCESVGLHHGRKLAAADATYAMTADAAVLLHDRALFSTHAGYSLTGDAAGLGSTRILTASHAVFTETAEAAGVYKGYDLHASLATFTETAEASALHYDRVLAASLASFTLILIAPNVTQVSYVYPAAAQFIEQGGVMGDIQVVGGVSAAFQDAGATEGDVRPSQSSDP